MTEISASLVKELREKSGAGMMECKKALVENKGDMEAAMDFLRKKGLASAGKKAGRAAAEGLVSVASQGNSGIAVEHFPPSVDDQCRVRLMPGENLAQRGADAGQLRLVQRMFGVRGGVSPGQQQRVALAQRDLQLLAEPQNHLRCRA